MTNDTTMTQLSLFDLELWRPVVGFEEFYAVSNYGRVKRTSGIGNRTKAGRLLKPIMERKGYMCVDLHGANYNKRCKIHRLVMHAFVGEPNGLQVNHIDGNKQNNHLPNLEYLSGLENMRHAFATGIRHTPKGEKNSHSILTQAQVDEIRMLYDGKRGTITKLSVKYGVNRVTISAIIHRKNWR